MKRLLSFTALLGLILAVTGTAGATTYGGSVTPLWALGTGQPTGNFVVDDNGNVQTALRATGRFIGALGPVSGDGTYVAQPGTILGGTPTLLGATWNYNVHVNVDTNVPATVTGDGAIVPLESPALTLADVTIFVTIDDDPTPGVSSGVVLDVKALAEAEAGATIPWDTMIGLQMSENLLFSYNAAVADTQSKTWTFDPGAAGQYEFLVEVRNSSEDLLSSTEMQVQVVPEPLTMLGVFAGVAGLGGYVRKRRLATR